MIINVLGPIGSYPLSLPILSFRVFYPGQVGCYLARGLPAQTGTFGMLEGDCFIWVISHVRSNHKGTPSEKGELGSWYPGSPDAGVGIGLFFIINDMGPIGSYPLTYPFLLSSFSYRPSQIRCFIFAGGRACPNRDVWNA